MVDVIRYPVDKETGLLFEPPDQENLKVLLEVGGEVDEVSTTLRFFGDDLDPEELTRLLGQLPTQAFRKGDIYCGKVLDYIYKKGVWFLKISRSRQHSLEDQIDSLLDQLTNELAIWRDLTERYRADLFCGLWLENWNRGIQLSSGLMQRIADRGLDLFLDVYFDLHEDE